MRFLFSILHGGRIPGPFLEGEGGGGGGGGGQQQQQNLIDTNKGGQQQQQEAPKGFVGEDGAFIQGWTEKLPEDMGDKRAGFGKFKTVAELAKSYGEMESRAGRLANAVVVPGENATDAEKIAYRKALGIPDDATGYADIKPTKLPNGVEFSPEMAKPYFDLGASLGVPKATMQKLIDLHFDQESQRVVMIEGELSKQLEDGKKILERDWGSNYGAKMDRADKAARMVGLDPTKVVGFRDPETLKAFVRLSEMLDEDKFISASSSTLSTHQSATEIMNNKDHPLHDKYHAGDPDTVAHVRSLLARAAK